MMIKRRFSKWGGYFSTLLIFVVAITPNTFHIPTVVQPWIFLGSIFWIIAFSSGVMSS